MIAENYYLIAFDSTHQALAAEQFFKELPVPAKLIFLPSIISAGCGFALKFTRKAAELARPRLSDTEFSEAKFYKITKTAERITVDDWVI